MPYKLVTNSGNSSTMQDQPPVALTPIQAQGYTIVGRVTSFNLYLMWQPSISPSFSVPLYILNWSMSGTATLGSAGWQAAGTTVKPVPAPTTGYPTWSGIAVIGASYTCQ
jgi:hypothetical protein